MPLARLTIRRVLVWAIPVYQCATCGATAGGSTVRRELTDPDSDLASACGPISNNHMPIGWRGDWLDKHRCPTCQGL